MPLSDTGRVVAAMVSMYYVVWWRTIRACPSPVGLRIRRSSWLSLSFVPTNFARSLWKKRNPPTVLSTKGPRIKKLAPTMGKAKTKSSPRTKQCQISNFVNIGDTRYNQILLRVDKPMGAAPRGCMRGPAVPYGVEDRTLRVEATVSTLR